MDWQHLYIAAVPLLILVGVIAYFLFRKKPTKAEEDVFGILGWDSFGAVPKEFRKEEEKHGSKLQA